MKVELSYADGTDNWLSIRSRSTIIAPDPREVVIRIAMLHPFMTQYSNLDSRGITAVLNIAAAMALSEVIGIEQASSSPKDIRRYSNEILKNICSVVTNG